MEDSREARTKEEHAREDARKKEEQARQRELEQAKALAQEREQHIAEQDKATSRLRWGLAGLVVVLGIAVGTAFYAFQQTQVAEEKSRVATSLRLVTESPRHISDQLDLAALLSVEAYRADNNAKSQAALLNGLLAAPGFTAFLHGHDQPVWSVAFSPDGTTLASASTDLTIRLWDVTTRQPLGAPLTGHDQSVWSVAFSPDGTTLASASTDGTIRLWDVTTRQPLGAPLTGHTRRVWGVAFSPDGTTLASASTDRTIRLWDVTTRQPLGAPLTGPGHTQPVLSVAFSPDGTTLASASTDGTICLWDVNPDSWRTRSCSRANRNFTCKEWAQYMGEEPYRATCPGIPVDDCEQAGD